MKKIVIALLLIVVVGVVFVGCDKDKATLLPDDKTLEVIDNTLGEGRDYNVKFRHTYTNSVVNEAKGYIYVLPISTSNPTLRYFASIPQQQATSAELIEITNIRNGDKRTKDNFVSFQSLWEQGMQCVEGTTTNVNHYSEVVTTTKYRYMAKTSTITVWGDKYLAVTITNPDVSANPISFTIEVADFYKLPMIISHVGDSWTVVESKA